MNTQINPSILSIVANGEVARLSNRSTSYGNEARLQSWINAVSKAAQKLSDGAPVQAFEGKLAIYSQDSGKLYIADRKTCQCESYVKGQSQPCWHRAAHTLVNKVAQVEGVLEAGD